MKPFSRSPEQLATLIRGYQVDQGAEWLAERCDIEPERFERRAWLYEDYAAWARVTGYEPYRRALFYEALDRTGFRSLNRNGIRGYMGIRLKGDWRRYE